MLLFDENLSRRLVPLLSPKFPACTHVSALGLQSAEDSEVWRQARAAGLAIVTKDTDFQALALTLGPPPKVVLVALGNCTTTTVAQVLTDFAAEIHAFLDGDGAVLILGLPSVR